jgi:hypothetical protein
MDILIWVVAAALYAAFWSWYVGFGRRVRPTEIERLMQLLAAHGMEPERTAILRRFLEADDGGEFVMVNVLAFREPKAKARDAFMNYQRRFIGRLLRLAGHPVFAGRALDRQNLEQWGIEAEGWDLAGLVRYRSRRDLARMVEYSFATDTREFKHLAIERTFAFPVTTVIHPGGPRLVVAIALALAAALVQIAVT